jgi:hypothetical protein
MTQTVPATAVLGAGKTGLSIGYRVLNLDGTEYSAWTTAGVAETSVAGTYRASVVVPDTGGYIVWGESGTDYAEATVESAAVPVTLASTQPAVTFGQVKILANVANQGALHVHNSNAMGYGQYNFGARYGLHNYGMAYGEMNLGMVYGQYNEGVQYGQVNVGSIARVLGVDQVGVRAAVGLATANLDTQLAAVAKTADVDAAVALLLNGLAGTTVQVVTTVSGGTVMLYAADTWRFTVASDQLDLADYETLALIVKRHERQADSQALLYLRSDTGLVRIGGAAPVSAGNGALTKTSSSFTAVVHVAETQGVTPGGGYTWWLKGIDTTPAPDEAMTLAKGSFVVLPAGLQAVV